MIQVILARLKQTGRTTAFPDGPPPALPERFRGRPVVERQRCQAGCGACVAACPAGAIGRAGGADAAPAIDLGRCIFCTDCVEACASGAISHDRDYRLAVSRREDLRPDGPGLRLAAAMGDRLRRILGRSLKLRQVSAGGCNACEADTNVLSTIGWDLGRFGIQFVASPRHADGILVTGPVSANMKVALLKTYEAVPKPKVVIAVGACAISGGIFAGHAETCDGAAGLLPIDLFIPGCPPHPLTILDGLLRLIGAVGAAESTPRPADARNPGACPRPGSSG